MAMRSLLLASVPLSIAASACGLGNSFNLDGLTSDKVIVATLLSVPERHLAPPELMGTDVRASSELASDGGVTLPGQTLAFAFFGQLEGEALDREPQPVRDAELSVEEAGGTRIPLTHEGNGVYRAQGATEPELKYEARATYDFVARHEGEEHVGRVVEAPLEEKIAEFQNGLIRLPLGSPLTLNRPQPPAGQERPLGFVTVYKLGESWAPEMPPTYTTLPDTPLELLTLGVRPGELKQTQVLIPASAFPEAERTYMVTFHAAKTGGPHTDNLNLISLMLVGTADVGVVRVE